VTMTVSAARACWMSAKLWPRFDRPAGRRLLDVEDGEFRVDGRHQRHAVGRVERGVHEMDFLSCRARIGRPLLRGQSLRPATSLPSRLRTGMKGMPMARP